MRSFTDEALDAIADGTALAVGAVEIMCDPPVRVWGGPWPTTINGKEYLGVGDRGLVQAGSAAIGAAAQNLTLELSGVDPAALDVLDAAEVRAAPVVLRRLIFNGSGTRCLDVHVFRRGRLDQIVTEETVGGAAVIRAMVEGAARGLGRRGGRMRTDADQRLINANDGGMRHVSYAGQKMLYWGGKVPTAAKSALGGSSSGSSVSAA
ncbi:hypothetical protein [Sphingomonas sp. Leaf37]|uniref:hypothetical protein n=1 Tax=Sphingomonas sp. Leaf37 TaxID=2876552 RepID=UPI001E52E43C|nr:hypothetical protein [Sphingomonas sp. Leaf37]